MMQNKNSSNREKRMIDKNEYLSTNIDKLKDDNEKLQNENNEIGEIE